MATKAVPITQIEPGMRIKTAMGNLTVNKRVPFTTIDGHVYRWYILFKETGSPFKIYKETEWVHLIIAEGKQQSSVLGYIRSAKR